MSRAGYDVWIQAREKYGIEDPRRESSILGIGVTRSHADRGCFHAWDSITERSGPIMSDPSDALTAHEYQVVHQKGEQGKEWLRSRGYSLKTLCDAFTRADRLIIDVFDADRDKRVWTVLAWLDLKTGHAELLVTNDESVPVYELRAPAKLSA